MDAENSLCVRCRSAPSVTDLGFCGHCHWKTKSEVANGWAQLIAYLKARAAFSDWCLAHGRES